MPIRVDRSSPVPLYFQVAQHLEQMIESGELPMGTRLENETDLADQLGLSRPTMRRAIEYLVGRGLLVRKRGIGTQVVHTKVTREVELTSLYDDLAKTGRDPSTRVVSFRTEAAADALAGKLGIPAGTQVYVFERLRYADAEPLALMRNHVPVHLLRLSPADLEAQGLYNLLRANGVTMRIAKQAIGARAATAAEARCARRAQGGAAADDGTFGLRRPRARGGTRPPPVPRVALQLRSDPDRLVSQVTAAAGLEAANPPDVGPASAEFGFTEVPQASYPPEVQSDDDERRPPRAAMTKTAGTAGAAGVREAARTPSATKSHRDQDSSPPTRGLYARSAGRPAGRSRTSELPASGAEAAAVLIHGDASRSAYTNINVSLRGNTDKPP